MHHGPIWWIIVGLIAGGLAKLVVPGPEGGGCIGSIIVGLIGSLVGGFVMSLLLGYSMTGFIGSIIVAFLGAVILLVIWHALARRGGGTPTA